MLPELLCPVGGLRQLQAAVRFGADAVYMGVQNYGLRAFAGNFTFEEMADAIKFCHKAGVKAYVTLNIFPFDDDLPGYLDAAKRLCDMGIDAAIVSDMGALDMLHHEVPELELHLSTQANAMNTRTVLLANRLGAKRIVLAREMSLARIKKMHAQLPEDVELEAFVHGAVCMSFSGRCVLSDYLAGRAANKGACAQPCRWQYAVVEEKRPGEYMPVETDERGTYIFSSGDLRMLEHLPDLIDAGIDSLKIEGRMKNEYYVSAVARCYRRALDLYAKSPENYTPENPEVKALGVALDRISHRRSDTGFFYGSPKPSGCADGFFQNSEFTGYVMEYDAQNSSALVEVRNRMLLGDTIGILSTGDDASFVLDRIENPETGESMDGARIGKSIVRINMPHPVETGDMLYGVVRNHLR
ncbi:MAG: U32 family peptidase [Clostridiales bacterium]|nr:U32 family peptidase [Clostridiales bacterium]